MSNQSIDHSELHLKKLRRAIDKMDILAHEQRQLKHLYRELAQSCLRLADNMDHMDAVAFEVRQEFEKIKVQ